MRNAPAQADLSIAELLQKLAAETSLLIRQEVMLARSEVLGTLKQATRPAADFGIAALFAIGAFGTLTTLFIAALSLALPVWAAALIVTVIYGAVAAFAAMRGRSSLTKIGSPIPDQTIQTIKDDITEVRAGIARGR